MSAQDVLGSTSLGAFNAKVNNLTVLGTQTNVGPVIDENLTLTGNLVVGGSSTVNTLTANSISTGLFQLTEAPAEGYILTSDASGNGTWAPTGTDTDFLAGNNIVLTPGVGTLTVATVTSPTFTNITAGANITAANLGASGGIVTNSANFGSASVVGALTAGSITATATFSLPPGATAGYVLTSNNSSGLAHWAAPTSDVIVQSGSSGNITVSSTPPSTYTVDIVASPTFTGLTTGSETVTGTATVGNLSATTASVSGGLGAGTVTTAGFTLSTSPGAGKILTSNASGVGSWQTVVTDVTIDSGPSNNLTVSSVGPSSFVIDTVGNPTFSGLVTAQRLGTTATSNQIQLNLSSPYYSYLSFPPNLSQNTIYTLPDPLNGAAQLLSSTRNVVTQVTSTTTAVTVNGSSGTINTFFGGFYYATTNTAFIVSNLYVTPASLVFMQVGSAFSSLGGGIIVGVSGITTGQFTVNIQAVNLVTPPIVGPFPLFFLVC